MSHFRKNSDDMTHGNTGKGFITKDETKLINTYIEKMCVEKDFEKRQALGNQILQTLAESIGNKSSDGVDNYDYLIAQQDVKAVVFTSNDIIASISAEKVLDIEIKKEKLSDTIAEIQEKYKPDDKQNNKGWLNTIFKPK